MSRVPSQKDDPDTPILDRLVPLPPPVKPGFMANLTGGLLTVLILYGIPLAVIYLPWFHHLRHWIATNFAAQFVDDFAGVRLLVTGFSIVLAGIAAVAVHECGHLFVGLSVGFRWKSIRVGPVQLDHSLRVSRFRTTEGDGAGWTCFFPEELNGSSGKAALMLLGGPLANLTFGGILVFLPIHKSLAYGAFVSFNLVLGLISLVPFRTPNGGSDGKRILNLSARKTSHERRVALAQLGRDLQAGTDLELLSPDLIAKATAVKDKSIETILAHTIGFCAAYSGKRDSDAAQFLETCLRYACLASAEMRASTIANAGIFQASRRGRIDLAKEWLGQLDDNLKNRVKRLKIEACILEECKDYEGTLKKIDEIEQGLTAEPQGQREMRALAKWRIELAEKMAPNASAESG